MLFLACILILWVTDRLLIRAMGHKTAVFVVVVLIGINIVLQIVCFNNLEVKPSWDFGAITSASYDLWEGHAIRNSQYFREYPFNLYTAVYVAAFRVLLGGTHTAPYILNILSATVSITGTCMLAYRLYGQRAAVLSTLFCLAVTPLYLNIPIVYTDMLSMPFVIWTVYGISVLHSGKKATFLYCVWIGLLCALGYLIKQIAALGLVAFLVDTIFSRSRYNTGADRKHNRLATIVSGWIPPVAVLLSFVSVVISARLFLGYLGYDTMFANDRNLPYTHWLAMGMNTVPSEGGTSSGYGGFSADDLRYSRSFPTVPLRKQANIARIKQRLRQYGIDGYAHFLLKKIEWTWTDGTYYVPVKLARYPLKHTLLHRFVIYSGGRANRLYRIFSQIMQAVLLSMICSGCIGSLRKHGDAIFRMMVLMCLGLMVFLLFWETRSRYLIFMIPVFIVMAVHGMTTAFDMLDRAFMSFRAVCRGYKNKRSA